MTESDTTTAATETTTSAGPPPPETAAKHQTPIEQARNTVKKVLDTILGRNR